MHNNKRALELIKLIPKNSFSVTSWVIINSRHMVTIVFILKGFHQLATKCQSPTHLERGGGRTCYYNIRIKNSMGIRFLGKCRFLIWRKRVCFPFSPLSWAHMGHLPPDGYCQLPRNNYKDNRGAMGCEGNLPRCQQSTEGGPEIDAYS